jgi:GPH family glycoside/pentoside/hexuronide:cation symporter
MIAGTVELPAEPRVSGLAVMAQPARLPAWRLLAYAGPAAPLTFLWIPIVVWIPTYYTQGLGLNLTIAGTIFLAARLWDGFIDPIVGGMSDRFPTRFGRRKIWMVAGAGLLILAAHRLLVPPDTAGAGYLLSSILFFYFFWTIVQIPHMAWAADLSPSYRERNRIAGFRSLGAMTGIALVSLLPAVIYGDRAQPKEVLRLYAQVLTWLLPITVLVAVLFVPEGTGGSSRTVQLREIFRTLIHNKPFRHFLLAFFLWDFSLALFEIPMLFLVDKSLLLPGKFSILLAIDYCTAILLTPLTVMAANRLGKHRTFAICGLFLMLGCVVLGTTGQHNFAQASLGYMFVGASISGFWIIPTSMVADGADIGRLETGADQMGVYMATFNLVWKVALASGAVVGLPLLDAMGFNPGSTAINDGLALLSLKIVGLALPCLLILPSIVLLWRYPLTEKVHDGIRERIRLSEIND